MSQPSLKEYPSKSDMLLVIGTKLAKAGLSKSQVISRLYKLKKLEEKKFKKIFDSYF